MIRASLIYLTIYSVVEGEHNNLWNFFFWQTSWDVRATTPTARKLTDGG